MLFGVRCLVVIVDCVCFCVLSVGSCYCVLGGVCRSVFFLFVVRRMVLCEVCVCVGWFCCEFFVFVL